MYTVNGRFIHTNSDNTWYNSELFPSFFSWQFYFITINRLIYWSLPDENSIIYVRVKFINHFRLDFFFAVDFISISSLWLSYCTNCHFNIVKYPDVNADLTNCPIKLFAFPFIWCDSHTHQNFGDFELRCNRRWTAM